MNGRQVDPFKVKIPPSRPVQKEYLERFDRRRDEILAELNKIDSSENTADEKSS